MAAAAHRPSGVCAMSATSDGAGSGAGSGAGAGLHARARRWAIKATVITRTDRLVNRLAGSIVSAGPSRRSIALTFDDGPHPAMTPAVLDVLDAHDARCTFFVVVDRAEEHPGLVRDLLDRGHEVALHGATHRRLTAPFPVVVQEIRRAKGRLEALTGTPVRWFRPAYGVQTVRSFMVARTSGLEVVMWSADLADWEPVPEPAPDGRAVPGEALAPADPLAFGGSFKPAPADSLAFGGTIGPGSIVLLHDVPNGFVDEHTEVRAKIELLVGVFERLAAERLQPLTLTALLEAGGAVRAPKFRPHGPEPATSRP